MLLPGVFGGDAQEDACGERAGEVSVMSGGQVLAHPWHGAEVSWWDISDIGGHHGGRGDQHLFTFAMAGIRLSQPQDIGLRGMGEFFGP